VENDFVLRFQLSIIVFSIVIYFYAHKDSFGMI